ncbi:MAG TPA: hypothetical protein DCF99_08325, partial [Flavobacteriaceae bacterium]|nr:hypothetical protein [Flavobacteriaceae bacterium]
EPIFFKRKINLLEIILAIIVSACVAVIFNASPEDYKLGIIIGILCSFLSALFAVLNSRLPKSIKPTKVTLYE